MSEFDEARKKIASIDAQKKAVDDAKTERIADVTRRINEYESRLDIVQGAVPNILQEINIELLSGRGSVTPWAYEDSTHSHSDVGDRYENKESFSWSHSVKGLATKIIDPQIGIVTVFIRDSDLNKDEFMKRIRQSEHHNDLKIYISTDEHVCTAEAKNVDILMENPTKVLQEIRTALIEATVKLHNKN